MTKYSLNLSSEQAKLEIKMRNSIKCVVVGDGSVGKTCLLKAYTTNSFPIISGTTVIDNYSTELNIEGQKIQLAIVDTSGYEEYDRLRSLLYKDEKETNVFLVCFSLVDSKSLERVKSYWFPEIQRHCPDTPIVLVGTKMDLRDELDVQMCVNHNLFPVQTVQG